MSKPRQKLFSLAILLLLPTMTAVQRNAFGGLVKSSSVPTISAYSPNSVTAGAANFNLSVTGTNFVAGSTTVVWSGPSSGNISATVLSSTSLTVTIPASLVSKAGNASFYVSVAGRNGGNSNQVGFTINASSGGTGSTGGTTSPLAITTAAIPSGTQGSAYSTSLTASGGTSPYSWSAGTGLPPGITLASTGALSGTPTSSGSYSFTATVKDSASATVSQAYSVSIGASTTTTPLSITSLSVPGGTSGTPYNATLAATGGTSPYTWTVSAGSLPAGVTLSSGGALSGTPSATGSFSFTAQVKDSAASAATATQALSLTVGVSTSPLAISTASVPGGTQGAAYSASLAATGGTSPYTWTVSSGALPTGVTLGTTGALSGTPSVSGSFSFVAQCKDSAANAMTQTYSMSIAASTTSPLAVSTPKVPQGHQNAGYDAALAANGGTPPYAWGLYSGTLPAGVTLSTSGGLTGTPTTRGVSSFVAQVKDSTGATANVTYSLPVGMSPIQVSNGFEEGVFTGYWSQSWDATNTSIITSTDPTKVHSGSHALQLYYHICGIPGAPTLSYTPGGTLPQTTYYVKVTGYRSGETTPSPEVSLTVPAGNLLVVQLPPAQPDLTGTNVYVGTAPGGEQLQVAAPLVQASLWTLPATGLVAGVAPPTTFAATCGPSAQDMNLWVGLGLGNWDGYPTGASPIYVQGWWYFKHPEADGAADNIQRKLIYLQDVPSPSNWSVVLTSFSSGGAIPLAVAYLQGGTGGQQLPYIGTSLRYDTWYKIQFGVVPNTPGLSDGSMTVWINGTQVWQQTGINMRGNFSTGIGWVMIGQQSNRTAFAPVDEYRYVDDVLMDYIPIP